MQNSKQKKIQPELIFAKFFPTANCDPERHSFRKIKSVFRDMK